jgi:23S rRNA (uracil1939-C5)-methyltransferase
MIVMNWPETIELSLDGIAQGGEGVGRWQERVVFASGGLPGERVLVALGERHAAYARGVVVEVLEASPERVPPRLPGADHMPWQHIAYPAQLRFKRQILADQLAKIGGLAGVTVEETVPAARPWGYRNSARLHGDGARLGYYAAGTRDLQPIDSDPLLLPVLNQALAALWAAAGETRLFPREVLLRASETYGYALGVIGGPGDLRLLAARWRARCPQLAGVLWGAPVPLEVLGAGWLVEELGGVAFSLHPTTFFQVNVGAAEALLRLTRAGLELRGERLLDLYCGAGAFALPLAAQAGQVLGVEEGAGAVEDARRSAEENGIANVRFEVGRAEDVLGRFDEPFDTVVLDPPRRGCHPRALEHLLRLAPARIVYVSCHPATLARDLKILAAGGYRMESVRPVDLFPQTAHVESVTVLMRA